MDIKFQFKITDTIRNVNVQFSIDEMYLLTESSDKCLSFYDISNAQITSTYEIGKLRPVFTELFSFYDSTQLG